MSSPRPIPTRGGRRAPLIPPSPATLALIETCRAEFEALYTRDVLTGSSNVNLNTHRRDGSSRRDKRVPSAEVPRA